MQYDILGNIGDSASPLEKAAKDVLREALDCVPMHPCDEGDDRLAAKRLSLEHQALLKALTGYDANRGSDESF